MSRLVTPSSSGESPTSSVVASLRLVGEDQRLHLVLAQRLDHRCGAGDRQAVGGGGLDLLEHLGALRGASCSATSSLARRSTGSRSAPAARPPSSMVDDEVGPHVARAVGEDLPGPDVAGHEHEPRREPAGHRGDLGGDSSRVVDPLVLGVVLVAVVRPAADLDLADLEAVALDGLLLARPRPDAPM